MSGHHARIVPVRVREHDAALGVDVSRIVGYRAKCSCGWRSKLRRNVREARMELRTHHAA
jgi:hypothetical protein